MKKIYSNFAFGVRLRKNKRLGIKIKHACVRSDVVFTKISASFLYKVWMIFWCSSSLPPPKSFPIERNVIKYEKIVGFLFRLIKTHCYQRKLELEWWSWLYFLNDFFYLLGYHLAKIKKNQITRIPTCKNKKKYHITRIFKFLDVLINWYQYKDARNFSTL